MMNEEKLILEKELHNRQLECFGCNLDDAMVAIYVF